MLGYKRWCRLPFPLLPISHAHRRPFHREGPAFATLTASAELLLRRTPPSPASFFSVDFHRPSFLRPSSTSTRTRPLSSRRRRWFRFVDTVLSEAGIVCVTLRRRLFKKKLQDPRRPLRPFLVPDGCNRPRRTSRRKKTSVK